MRSGGLKVPATRANASAAVRLTRGDAGASSAPQMQYRYRTESTKPTPRSPGFGPAGARQSAATNVPPDIFRAMRTSVEQVIGTSRVCCELADRFRAVPEMKAEGRVLGPRSDHALLAVALIRSSTDAALSKVSPSWACVHMRFSMCCGSRASHLVDIEIR